MPELGEPPADADPAVVRDEPGLRVTVVPVGWVEATPGPRQLVRADVHTRPCGPATP